MDKNKYMIVPGKWEIEYRYAAGPYATKFFKGLMEKKIYGVRCPSCRRVLMPPRRFCERCMVETNEWVEVSSEGVLENFIITYRKFYGLPDPPYVTGLIKLDDSDEAILHFVGGIDISTPSKALKILKPGIRVRAVWAEKRKGSITDIKYFKPIE